MTDTYKDIVDNKEVLERLRRPLKPSTNPDSFDSRISNVKVIFRIHIDDMKDEDIEKIIAAKDLLNEAGITFDSGMGHGHFDWFLNDSLTGAHVKVKP